MISIAIATYNRADELKLTLQSLEALRVVDQRKLEILVVDNNSKDATRSIVEAFEGRLPGSLRYIHEAQQGLSHARNRAIAEARSGIVAFLDDDVDVDPNWLTGLAATFEEWEPAAVGGRASLRYPRARPSWLGERDEGYLTKVELGPLRRAAAPDELFGVNLAIKKQWFDRVGGFRTDLGRVGTCLIGSEEGELLERITATGGLLVYEPRAMVCHRVPSDRLSRRWFWSRTYWGHRAEVRRWNASQISASTFLRTTWHIALAGWGLLKSSSRRGLFGEQTFHESLLFVARIGLWVGFVDRFYRSRPSECGSVEAHPPVTVVLRDPSTLCESSPFSGSEVVEAWPILSKV